MGFLSRLEDSRLRESPLALFELVHSSFEYAVYLLHHGETDAPSAFPYLVQQIGYIRISQRA